MKQQRIITYFINLCVVFLMCSTSIYAQEENTAPQDSIIKVKQKYGLRLGIDMSKLVRAFVEDDYKGIEINGDYRLTKNWYIAGEIGTEEKTTVTDFLNSTAKGTYLKVGGDYNMYTNWLDMENMVYTGFRVGTSSFSQTLNEYTVYTQNQYWQPQFTNTEAQEFKGLSAIWLELQLGIKAEVLNNLFIGLNVQVKALISEDQPDNFENVFIPGFNKTYDSGRIGVGYGYNISYLIPLFKKDK